MERILYQSPQVAHMTKSRMDYVVGYEIFDGGGLALIFYSDNLAFDSLVAAEKVANNHRKSLDARVYKLIEVPHRKGKKVKGGK